MAFLMRLLLIFAVSTLGFGHAADNRNLTVQTAPGSEKRVALVIGNGTYASGAALKNPPNDARDVAVTLRDLGFDVIEKIDVSQKEMNRAIIEFGSKLNAETVALFYFAGHGIQVRGKNYLLPVDSQISAESSVRAEAVDVDTVLDQLVASPLNLVILDACRNNPFERRFRSVGGGLAQIDAPRGTLIAYATAPGKVAADGSGRNGLYTQELLKALREPGLAVEQVFKRVRTGVTRASGEAQTPWESSSLTGEFYFRPGAGTQVAQLGGGIGTTGRSPAQIEDELWDAIKDSDKPKVFEQYLKGYPKGRYVIQAKVKLAALEDSVTSGSKVPMPDTSSVPTKIFFEKGLEWTQSDTGYISWENAKHYCAGLGRDWRLPSIAELLSLFNPRLSTPCGSYADTQFTCHVWSGLRLSAPAFWTNESNGTDAWNVDLTEGRRYTNRIRPQSVSSALCVRRL